MNERYSKTVLLFGHGGYYNRGCEAIVETTVAMLREARPNLRFILLSFDETRDRRRTPAIVDRTEPGYAPLFSLDGIMARLVYRVSRRAACRWMAAPVRRVLPEADLVLSVGGDNYCYADPEYFYYVDALARRAGKPVVLWGATVELPNPSAAKLADLRAFDAITAREAHTVQVLAQNGINRGVHLVSDPAFTLKSRPVETAAFFWPKQRPVLGLNLSPLVGCYTASGPESLFRAAVGFVRHTVDKGAMGVVLVPHVTEPMPGKEKWNDDAVLLARLLREVERPGAVTLMPSGLSAAQTKGVIGRCDYFIGARTHSTIASLSSRVPTLTLAYSAKARGINEDIFGDTRWVLDVGEFRSDTAIASLERLRSEGDSVRAHLKRTVDEVAERARLGAVVALALLDDEPVAALKTQVTSRP